MLASSCLIKLKHKFIIGINRFFRSYFSLIAISSGAALLASVILVSAASYGEVPPSAKYSPAHAFRDLDYDLVDKSPTMSLFLDDFAGDIWTTGVIYCVQEGLPRMFVSSFNPEGWAYFFSDFSTCDGGIYLNIAREDPSSITGLIFNTVPERLARILGLWDELPPTPELRLWAFEAADDSTIMLEPVTFFRSEGSTFWLCDTPLWGEYGMPYARPFPPGSMVPLDLCETME